MGCGSTSGVIALEDEKEYIHKIYNILNSCIKY